MSEEDDVRAALRDLRDAVLSAPSCDVGWRDLSHEVCIQQLEVWRAECLALARAALVYGYDAAPATRSGA